MGGWAVAERGRECGRGGVGGWAARFRDGRHGLRGAAAGARVFVTSLVSWLAETVKYWFVMHSFPFAVPFFVLMLMNGVVNLATTIPSSPGHVGTVDPPGLEVRVA